MNFTQDYYPSSSISPEIWESFLLAQTSTEFCQAWLDLISARMANLKSGTVLIEGNDAQTFVPIARTPKEISNLDHFSQHIERVLQKNSAVIASTQVNDSPLTIVIHPIFLNKNIIALVGLEFLADEASIINQLRELQWGIAWLINLFAQKEWDDAVTGSVQLQSVMELIAISLKTGKLQQVLFELLFELRKKFDCSRVALGLVNEHKISLKALSDNAVFQKNSNLINSYVRAMEETLDNNEAIEYNIETADNDFINHQNLLLYTGTQHLLSYPLRHGIECVGILTIEKTTNSPFTSQEYAWLETFSRLFAAVLVHRKQAENSLLKRIWDETKAFFKKLLGPEHLTLKAVSLGCSMVIICLVLVHIDYRVKAKTVIEGEIQQTISAPFEGFIGVSYVRAGDYVQRGQLLATLDDRELSIEHEKFMSSRDQYDKKLREALANHDLSEVQIVSAQLAQAEAELHLIKEKIQRASLTSPYDGIVISGDLSQQVGAPVESGKKLFEIAPLASYRVMLQVDEREIRHVKIGQPGKLLITGVLGKPIDFTIHKITAVATTQGGKNFFRVEAKLHQISKPLPLLPGMEGIGKVETGPRRLGWILLHSFTDWLHVNLWSWTL